jgi:hypothetical protein
MLIPAPAWLTAPAGPAILENGGKDVLEVLAAFKALPAGIGVAFAGLRVRVMPVGARRRFFGATLVDLTAVVAGPFLGIGQQLIGGGNRLEFVFRRLVAGIQVRMVLLRQFAVGFADVLGAGVLLDAQNFIRIFSP